MSSPITSRAWLTVRNQASAPAAEILIQGQIGASLWDDSGMSEREFVAALDSIPKGRPIVIGINSEGGSVKDGLGIYNAIKRRDKDVTCRVDGYAVSIASVIALAGGRVVSPPGSLWMIHEPWGYTQGSADDHRLAAEMLERHGEALCSIYALETGRSPDDIRAAMRSETWLTGEQAVEFGLADECSGPQVTLQASKMFKIPPHLIPTISVPAVAGAVTGGNTPHQKQSAEPPKPMTLIQALVEAKIVPSASITEDEAVVFLHEHLIANAAAVAVKDKSIADLTATVEANRKANAESVVAAAVKAGKIKDEPVLREAWVKALLTDEASATSMLSAVAEPPKADAPKAGHPPIDTPTEDPTAKPKLAGIARVAAAFQAQFDAAQPQKRN